VSIEQIGDRLRLEWKAPSHNRDHAGEELDLREARVLRRVIDLAALVKAQTHSAPAPAPAPGAAASSPESEVAPAETTPKAGMEPSASTTTTTTTTSTPPGPESTPAASESSPTEAQPGQPGQPGSTTPSEPGAETEPPGVGKAPQVVIPPFESEAVVVATEPAGEPGGGARYEELVDPEWIGKRVEYGIVYANRKKRVSAVSARVQIDPVRALVPPGAPQAEVGDGTISLAWTPVEDASAGLGLGFGYVVFRKPGPAPPAAPASNSEFPASPVEEAPLPEPAFVDHGIVFGNPLCYAVATVELPQPAAQDTQGETLEPEAAAGAPVGEGTPAEIVPVVPPIAKPPRIRSPLSEEVCVTPEDHFPPPVPTGVVAVGSGEGILLTWRAVEARDLGGYRVYRASSVTGPFELLGEADTPTYVDAEAPAGEARFYVVTAVDDAPARNESEKSEVARATRPQ
jgi:hypothetical protein